MKLILWFGIIILAVCQAGCGANNFQQGQKLDHLSVKNIRTGKTTKKEVIQMFGQPPSRQSTGGGNEVWTYQFSQLQSQVSPGSYIPIVNLFATSSEVQSDNQVLRVRFTGDIVADCTYNKSTSKTKANLVLGGVQTSPSQINNVMTPCEEAQ